MGWFTGCFAQEKRTWEEATMDLQSIEKTAGELQVKLRALGRPWGRDSVALCLWHNGKCEYCGFDLLSSQGICYYFWCKNHLLPHVKYPELTKCIENKVLACTACTSVKGEYDPDTQKSIYTGNGRLTMEQRELLLKAAKEYVQQERARLEESFRQEIEVLKPYLARWSSVDRRTEEP